MSPTSTMQKLMNLVDEFGKSDHSENEAKRAFASTNEPNRADSPSFDYVSHTVSNIVSNSAKNVSNYPILDVKRAFDQLRQALIETLIFQYFNAEWYIWVETDASGYAIGGVLSQLTNDLGQWHPVTYFLHKIMAALSKKLQIQDSRSHWPQ